MTCQCGSIQNPWVVIEVGCLECGEPTNIVGVFSKEDAEEQVRKLAYSDEPEPRGIQALPLPLRLAKPAPPEKHCKKCMSMMGFGYEARSGTDDR